MISKKINRPKIFDRADKEISYSVKRLNEDQWFKTYQHLILAIANTDEGRDLLCIDKKFPKITKMGKNFIQCVLGYENGRIYRQTEFRIGAKWANVIRFRWKEFQDLVYRMNVTRFYDFTLFNTPVLCDFRKRFTESTFYPDPSVESTSVDGWTTYQTAGTWAAMTGATSGTADDTSGANEACKIGVYSPSSQWYEEKRTYFLYDTSAIDDADAIDAGVHSTYLTSKNEEFDDSISLIASAPASNTAIVAGDHDSFGSTKFAADVNISDMTASQYNSHTMNASGLAAVDNTGITKLGYNNTSVVDNAEPTPSADWDWAGLSLRMADYAGTSSDPKLVITHSVPSTFVPRSILIG